MKNIIIGLIKTYQRVLSPDRGWISLFFPGQPTCRFTPSCSQYAITAVGRYGIIKGLFLSAKRILRCHPWHPGGIDNLP